MNREQVFEKLNEVFRDVFDDESICVNDSTTSNDIEAVSYTHLEEGSIFG